MQDEASTSRQMQDRHNYKVCSYGGPESLLGLKLESLHFAPPPCICKKNVVLKFLLVGNMRCWLHSI